jgi:hypothetical protein
VPFNAAESGVTRKPFRTIAFKEKDYDSGLEEGGLLGPHQSPFALNRSHLASLQLRSLSSVHGFPSEVELMFLNLNLHEQGTMVGQPTVVALPFVSSPVPSQDDRLPGWKIL